MAVTVALDGRGAERGSDAVIDGVRAAAADGIRLRVFGDLEALRDAGEIDGVELIAASDEITNSDEPVAAAALTLAGLGRPRRRRRRGRELGRARRAPGRPVPR